MLVRGLSEGEKASLLTVFGTVLVVELGSAAGFHDVSVPLLAPFVLVFHAWWSLPAGSKAP